ncbi:hypothetical protein HYD48_00825 [Mycoplasmopsis bovis]|nr:hypothetical protein [Mycoplasmopsis bovis]QQH77680.1 hypothetical protein HYD48_00825 [Mycoplasmopsis bovis]
MANNEFLNKPQFLKMAGSDKDNNLLELIKSFFNVKLKIAKWCIELLNEWKKLSIL